MSNHKNTALLDCPFCAAQPRAYAPTCTQTDKYNPTDRAYPVVRCPSCYVEVSGKNWDYSCDSAVEKWNTRNVKGQHETP